jgi:hypothetical protein
VSDPATPFATATPIDTGELAPPTILRVERID